MKRLISIVGLTRGEKVSGWEKKGRALNGSALKEPGRAGLKGQLKK